MANLVQGANAPVVGKQTEVTVSYRPVPGVDLDVSAFLLAASGKVRSDADMCFYGQPAVGGGAVAIVSSSAGKTQFRVDLDRVGGDVERVAFTATIFENKARFSAFSEVEVRVPGIEAPIPTAGRSETALILGEFYRRNGEWKYRNVSQGFEGGLGPLATHFGVEIEAPSAPAAKPRVSLEKKVEAKAPALVSLAKKAAVSLAKKKLDEVSASVYLVLDASGSMSWQYRDGKVQEVVNRFLPLAVHFDDDGVLDTWAFANNPFKLTPVTLDNYARCISSDKGGWNEWKVGARGNNEPAVIDDIVAFHKASKSRKPVFVIFISDGGIYETKKITERIVKAASLPIFWQFVGVGGQNYGVLTKLDGMKGRIVDNAGFFAIDDLHSISEEELYDRLMHEFPLWLKSAKAAGIID
jgi:stress response protein SCP2